MRIGLIVNSLNVGGMETMLFELAKGLRDLGARVDFVATQSRGDWHNHPIEAGFEVVDAIPRPYANARSHARRTSKIIGRYDAVILSHSTYAQAAIGLLPNSVVALAVLHNNNDEIYRVGLGNQRNCNSIIAVSDGVLGEALRRGALRDRIVCIKNGIKIPQDISVDNREELDGPLRLIYIGRLDHQQKGVLYLPEIVAQLQQVGQEIVLDVVGNGVDEVVLRQRLGAVLSAEALWLHGALEHGDALNVLAKADVCLMPSHYEGQGLVMLEAMARRVVPVVSRLEGVTDSVIVDGQSGFLVDCGDVAGFARAVSACASDREKLSTMKDAARKRVCGDFSTERMAREYFNLITECRQFSICRSGRLDLAFLGSGSFIPLSLMQFGSSFLNLLRRGI